MRRSNNRVIAGIVGLAVAGGLGVLGLVMTSNANFAKTYTAEQLSRQNITFKAVDTLTDKERQSPCLVRYAGQRLTTGNQAECYANDFIGEHVKDVAGGKTYAELGGPERALYAKVVEAQKASDPALPDLQKQHAGMKAQRDTLFQGETSRGLLLTSFGFSVLGAKADQAATAAFLAAVVLALLSVAGLLRSSRTPKEATVTQPRQVKAIIGDKQLVEV